MIAIRLKKLDFKLMFLLGLTGCVNNGGTNRVLNFKYFSIVAKFSDSIKIISKSQDDYNGDFTIGLDTVHFNFGHDINNLAEIDPQIVFYPYNEDSLRKNLDTTLVNPSQIVYTKKPNFDIDEYRKQNVYFESIGGFKGKITVPRVEHNGGITGVYFDSLLQDEGGRLKFNLYSKMVDSVRSENLIRSIKTIQFHLN
jgi:hypothetical protein